jgi:antitoxin component of MazEF toxin-antitoxin module
LKVAKWGNCLAIRLPAVVVERLASRRATRLKSMSPMASGLVLHAGPGATSCWSACAPFAVVCLPISSSIGMMQMPASFFDTNVLLYLASGDAAKADLAEAAVGAGGAISVQVLNELANVARRKMQMSWADTHALLTMLRGLLAVHPLTVEIHETGLGLPSATACRPGMP